MDKSSIEIAPSILAGDFLRLGDTVGAAELGGADRLHIDVMDGRFVPNITVGTPIVESIRAATGMFLEAHLMIVEPEKYVPSFAEAGADLITVHAEVSPHLYRTIEQIHDLGRAAGVAINPATSWHVVEEVLDLADLILIMTVSPGFGGQAFIEAMLPKVRRVREEIDRRHSRASLEVDGGIGPLTVDRVVQAGARVLVAGTAVYHARESVAQSISDLRTRGAQALSTV